MSYEDIIDKFRDDFLNKDKFSSRKQFNDNVSGALPFMFEAFIHSILPAFALWVIENGRPEKRFREKDYFDPFVSLYNAANDKAIDEYASAMGKLISGRI